MDAPTKKGLLTKEQWQQIFSIVFAAALAVFSVAGWVAPQPAAAPAVLDLDEIEARVREKISIDARDDVLMYNGADLIVYSDNHSTVKFTIDGATGAITSTGQVSVGTQKLVVATTQLVTSTVFTATATYQPITSTATVTPTVYTSTAVTGQTLILVNAGSNSIVFADTGTQVLSGNFTMGANDTLSLLFDGTNWLELRRSDN